MRRMIAVIAALAFLIGTTVPAAVQQRPDPPPNGQSEKTTTTQSASSPDEDEVVRITTNLVQIDAVVTDKDGKQVTDLKPEQFEILQDGRSQTISNFSYVSTTQTANRPTPPPADLNTGKSAKGRVFIPPAKLSPTQVGRTIALVLDDLGLSMESAPTARKALRKFVDEQMSYDDLVAIVRTGADVGTSQQFTSDKRLLHSAIDRLRWHPCSRVGVTAIAPIGAMPGGAAQTGRRQCAGSSLEASLRAFNAIVRGMRGLPGRKSMIVLSDSLSFSSIEPAGDGGPEPYVLQEIGGAGPSTGLAPEGISLYQRYKLIAEQAIRSSVVIHGIDTRGLQTTGIMAADDLGLKPSDVIALGTRTHNILAGRTESLRSGRDGAAYLAEQTGGLFIRNNNDITGGVRRIVDDLKGYYLIGYRPEGETFNRRFHQIKVRVKGRPGLTVRSRSGFYGLTEEEARPPAYNAADRLVLALISPFSSGQIALRLTPIFDSMPGEGPLLRGLLNIDAGSLTFKEAPDGGQRADIAIQGVLFGDNGQVVAEHKESYAVLLSVERLDSVRRRGLDYIFEMPAPKPGAFQFRVGVYDMGSERVGSVGQFVEVPDLNGKQLALSGLVISGFDPEAQTAGNGQGAEDPSRVKAGPGQPADLDATPSARRFRQSMSLDFSYAVFNARVDQRNGPPQLTHQTRLYRDGKLVLTGTERPLPVTGQIDPKRIAAGGRLQLGKELPPGDYLFQLIVIDKLAKGDQAVATQWIDFELTR